MREDNSNLTRSTGVSNLGGSRAISEAPLIDFSDVTAPQVRVGAVPLLSASNMRVDPAPVQHTVTQAVGQTKGPAACNSQLDSQLTNAQAVLMSW